MKQTSRSIQRHGPTTPFRHHTVVQQYIEGLLDRKGYKDFVECGVTVEKVEKVNGSWKLTLRKAGAERDYWWAEEFDAVVVASGHYTVPHVPYIEGLEEFASAYPGSVEHSKGYRGAEKYRQKVRLTRKHKPIPIFVYASTKADVECCCDWRISLWDGHCPRPHRSRPAPDKCCGARKMASLFRQVCVRTQRYQDAASYQED